MGKIEGGDALARKDMVTLIKQSANIVGSEDNERLAERRNFHIIQVVRSTHLSPVVVVKSDVKHRTIQVQKHAASEIAVDHPVS